MKKSVILNTRFYEGVKTVGSDIMSASRRSEKSSKIQKISRAR